MARSITHRQCQSSNGLMHHLGEDNLVSTLLITLGLAQTGWKLGCIHVNCRPVYPVSQHPHRCVTPNRVNIQFTTDSHLTMVLRDDGLVFSACLLGSTACNPCHPQQIKEDVNQRLLFHLLLHRTRPTYYQVQPHMSLTIIRP